MKKAGRFLSSMPFAIALLILLAAACALSSTIPQGQVFEVYSAQYGERISGLILALRLDDAFHSWWFIGLSAFLCLNLLCCNLIRLPALLRRAEDFADPEKKQAGSATAEATGGEDPRRSRPESPGGMPAGAAGHPGDGSVVHGGSPGSRGGTGGR